MYVMYSLSRGQEMDPERALNKGQSVVFCFQLVLFIGYYLVESWFSVTQGK